MKPLQEWEVKVTKMEFHKCPECPKAFLDVGELATHTKLHQEMHLAYALSANVKLKRVKILACDRCSCGFLSERQLLLHRLEHVKKSVNHPIQDIYYNKDKEKPYKCPECDYAFVAKSTLDAHLVIHEPFPHICCCGIGFYKQEDLQRHQKLVQCLKTVITDKIKTEIKDTKPPNELTKSEEKTKTHSTLKKVIKKKKVNVRKSKSRFENCNPTLPPLDVKFKKLGNNQFQCPECLKIFAAKRFAEIHYRSVHRGERPYACHLCEKKFTQSCALKQHLIVHSGVKEHECQYCKKLFSSFSAKSLHERTHTGYKPYECSYCSKTFSDPSAYKRHERIHTGDFKYHCEQCPMAFTDSSGLYAHRRRHNPEEPRKFACSQCDKKFTVGYILKKHISVVHNKEYNFPCEICGKRFSSRLNLKNHLNVHVRHRKKYSCNICGKELLGKEYLRIHIKNVHEVNKKHTCEICNKQFSTRTSFNNHMTVHTKIRKYECDYCSLRVRIKSDLFKHIVSKHIGILCTICSRYFPSQSSFDEHKLKVSEKCDICENEIFCKNFLQTHLLVHTKIPKAYECDYCGQAFTNRGVITKHLAKHMKYKFKCDRCGDHFKNENRLKKHMLRHSKIHCKVCRKRFLSKADLYKHEDIGCTFQKFGCAMCDKSFKLTRDLEKHEARCRRGWYVSEGIKCPLCDKVFRCKRSAIAHLRVHDDEIKVIE